jgi:hypothetical protein
MPFCCSHIWSNCSKAVCVAPFFSASAIPGKKCFTTAFSGPGCLSVQSLNVCSTVQQHVPPLDVFVLPLDITVLVAYTALAVSVLQQILLVICSRSACAVPERLYSTAACAVPTCLLYNNLSAPVSVCLAATCAIPVLACSALAVAAPRRIRCASVCTVYSSLCCTWRVLLTAACVVP